MVYSNPYKIVGRIGRSFLRTVMKIKTAFIIFAILVSNVYLAGTTLSNDLPGIENRNSNKNSGRGDGFVSVWNLDQPSTLRSKYYDGKEMEKISGMNLAQQSEPVRAPFFQGEGLPTPPQQNAPWPHGDDALLNAAAMLFEQGLADPRGLEYREIEIAVGNPFDGGGYPLKTHGWVLPNKGKAGQFAVAWSGLSGPESWAFG